MAQPTTTVETDQPTVVVACTFFNKGHVHTIVERTPIDTILRLAIGTHGTAKRVLVKVKFRNGSIRQIIAGEFTHNTPSRLAFEGMMANGSTLAKVRVTLWGDDEGTVEVID